MTAGQAVYLKASDGKWWKAKATATEPGSTGVSFGIALNGGAANQPAHVQTGGSLTIGATVAAGVWYYLSTTYGGIAPVADLGSGNYVSTICYGISTSVVKVSPIASGVALA